MFIFPFFYIKEAEVHHNDDFYIKGYSIPEHLLDRILKVQSVTRLPFQRKPKDKFWTPISKVLGSYLKNF
ncbi:unnamed protein product [Rhizophagus irregularis]|nr:unnamed protein product [Rhizophagus irregularis]